MQESTAPSATGGPVAAGSDPAPRISVVIPAHNEAAVIGRCLESVLAGAPSDELEILVVCNGCNDGTERVAEDVSPQIRVVESPIASKHAALNLGDETARGAVRVYLDADTVLSPGSLSAIADALEQPGGLVAAPEVRFDLSGCTWPARQFHRIWRASPYFGSGLVGAGVYAVSPEGRRRFDRFPPIVADDAFIQSLFAPDERTTVVGSTFTPLLPTTLRAMLHVHVRHYGAAAELRAWWAASGRGPLVGWSDHSKGWVLDLARSPSNWPGLVCFGAVKVAARILGPWRYRRGKMTRWNRDDASRQAAA